MNSKVLPLLWICCFPLLLHAQIYVDQNANGAHDGTSWENAYSNLQNALNVAPVDGEIWVAAGTYYPSPMADPTVPFVLEHGIRLYGGFAGTESSVDERELGQNKTILSGDYNGDDEVEVITEPVLRLIHKNYDENAERIIEAIDLFGEIIIDGFTITGAQVPAPFSGGGFFISADDGDLNVIIRNCDIVANRSDGSAAGLRLSADSGEDLNFTMENCRAWHNSSDTYFAAAGGLVWTSGPGTMHTDYVNCHFFQNFCLVWGGVIINEARVNARYISCIFEDNRSASGGAVYENSRGSSAYHNCVFYKNGASLEGFAIHNFNAFGEMDVHLYNCAFLENGNQPLLGQPGNGFVISNNILEYANFNALRADAPSSVNDGGNVFGQDPQFVDAPNDDYRLLDSSPGINAGNNDQAIGEKDFGGQIDRIVDDIVDIGVFEFHRPLNVETNDRFCFEDEMGSADLVADNYPPFTYEWSDSNIQGPNPDDLEEGEYEVTVFNDIGDYTVANFTIVKNTEITATIDYTIPMGASPDGTISVTAAGGTPPLTYAWNTGQTEANLTDLEKGIYTVTISDAANCEIIREVVLIPVGVQAVEEHPGIQVLPNPFTDRLQINLEKSLAPDLVLTEARLYDATGRLVAQQLLDPSGASTLSLYALPQGLYLLELIGPDQSFSQRLVKH